MALVGPSRGSELLVEWQGAREAKEAALLLDLDEADYSRFRNGKRRPRGLVAYRIEKITDGKVPQGSWYDPPIAAVPTKAKRKAKAS